MFCCQVACSSLQDNTARIQEVRTYTGWALDAVYTHVCADEAIHEAVHVLLLVSVHMFKLMHLHNTHLNIQIVRG